MSKVNRYYVDSEGNEEANIVIRDRTSPLDEMPYPTDIIAEITTGMFPDRKKQLEISEKICVLLNEEL